MNSFSLERIIRPHLLNLKPYSSARDEFKGKASVFLDANENPVAGSYNRYPDPRQSELKALLARIKKIDPDQLFLGNGSDEPIDLLIRACCEPGKDRILIPVPTYGMYQVSAAIHDIAVDQVTLAPDFSLPAERMLSAITPETKLIFLCSPNNPSGNRFDTDAVTKIMTYFNGIVVVDEAYIDFCPSGSFTEHLVQHPNLVILQTLSKAWGLAGLRLGLCMAQPELIAVLNRIKAPYNISSLVQETVIRELKGKSVPPDAAMIIEERNRLAGRLAELPEVLQVFPGEANFLLVKFNDASATYGYLRNHGIIVRDRSHEPLCGSCLRITVGTPDENDLLINTLKLYPNN
ncbi:MAG: histidinol-phosphate transaminase [Bacteroidota bacterium]